MFITTLYIMIGSVIELTQIWRNSQFLKLNFFIKIKIYVHISRVYTFLLLTS